MTQAATGTPPPLQFSPHRSKPRRLNASVVADTFLTSPQSTSKQDRVIVLINKFNPGWNLSDQELQGFIQEFKELKPGESSLSRSQYCVLVGCFIQAYGVEPGRFYQNTFQEFAIKYGFKINSNTEINTQNSYVQEIVSGTEIITSYGSKEKYNPAYIREQCFGVNSTKIERILQKLFNESQLTQINLDIFNFLAQILIRQLRELTHFPPGKIFEDEQIELLIKAHNEFYKIYKTESPLKEVLIKVVQLENSHSATPGRRIHEALVQHFVDGKLTPELEKEIAQKILVYINSHKSQKIQLPITNMLLTRKSVASDSSTSLACMLTTRKLMEPLAKKTIQILQQQKPPATKGELEKLWINMTGLKWEKKINS
ncbi:MAG: hypothetical protein V4591_00465 [Bdellovibrionota bacterium]